VADSYNELFGLGTHSEDAALEGWWQFQDNAATTAIVDSSSNGNNLTLRGGDNTEDKSDPSTPASYLGQSLLFNGTDDYADIGTALTSGTPTTIGGWFQHSAAESGRLVGHYVGTQVRVIGVQSFAGKRQAQHYDGSNAIATTAATVGSGWVHSVGLFPANNSRSIVTDGVVSNTETTSQNSIGTIDSFIVGRSPWSGGGQYANAKIVDLFCFSRALTTDEINETKNGPEPLNTVAPALSGTETEGETLTCSTGTWDSQSNGTVSYSYQWTRSNDGVGTGEANIAGETSSTYTLQAADVGKYIRCVVRGSNDGGFDSAEDTNSDMSGAISASGGGGFEPFWATQATRISSVI
jgi:hypothetical protein